MTWIILALLAHDPITTKITWDAEISRIVNRRCIACHAANNTIDLSSYEQARPWAKAMRNQVLQRSMPPWSPVKGFGNFANDPSLTPLELEMITQWVEGGAPEGNPAFLPKTSPVAKTYTSKPLRLWPAMPVITRTRTITAIQAKGPTEVSAVLPDGTVEHLLWIRDKKADWTPVYSFRNPITLPAGTKLKITGAPVMISAEARP